MAGDGRLGSAIVQGKVTDMLDAEAVIPAFEVSEGAFEASNRGVNGGLPTPTMQESTLAEEIVTAVPALAT